MNSDQIKIHNQYLEGLETSRLALRKLEKSDVQDWVEFFQQNPLLKYLNIKIFRDELLMSKKWIGVQLKRYEKFQFGHLGIIYKQTNRLIGQCGLIIREVEGLKEFEIAYSLIPRVWGKGIAHEASIEVINFAFSNKITNKLISIIHTSNVASQRVAIKNGMVKESN